MHILDRILGESAQSSAFKIRESGRLGTVYVGACSELASITQMSEPIHIFLRMRWSAR